MMTPTEAMEFSKENKDVIESLVNCTCCDKLKEENKIMSELLSKMKNEYNCKNIHDVKDNSDDSVDSTCFYETKCPCDKWKLKQ